MQIALTAIKCGTIFNSVVFQFLLSSDQNFVAESFNANRGNGNPSLLPPPRSFLYSSLLVNLLTQKLSTNFHNIRWKIGTWVTENITFRW